MADKIKSQRSAPQTAPREIRVAYCFFHDKRTKNAAGVPFVFGPKHEKAGQPNPRYSGAFMFPKLSNDPAQCPNYAWLWSLAVEAARKMWPQSVDAAGNWTWPAGARLAIDDGDVPYVKKQLPGQPAQSAEEIAKNNAWRRGYWHVEAENFLNPGPRICKIMGGTETPEAFAEVFDTPYGRAKTLTTAGAYKSGDFGLPNLHAYAYQNETFGINFGFDGFMFTREGDAIGSAGPRPADQMFGGSAPASAAGGVAFPTSSAPLSPSAAPAPALPVVASAPLAPVAASHSSPPMPPMPALPPLPGR